MSINIIIDGNWENTSTVLYERYYCKGKCKMIKNYIEKANFEDTGFSYAQSLISGKHKMVILYCLSDRGKSLMEVLDQLCARGEKNREE